jgi:YbbR domain-containing protein
MSWSLITNEWRLKLLALGLAVFMLGAVAFSQNPPTERVLIVTIGYPNLSADSPIVVINQPTTARVRVTALADVLQTVTPSSVAATFDLTKISPGPDQHVNLTVRSVDPRVKVQDPVVPYVLNIDKRAQVKLEVIVRPLHIAPGWTVTAKEAQCPGAASGTLCQATFTGPVSYETGLKAYVDYPTEVNSNSVSTPSLPVSLELNGQKLELTRVTTFPAMTLDPLNVNVHIEAVSTIVSKQVTLVNAQPVHGPAQGYRVTNVTLNPVTVVVTGRPEALAQLTTITLPPVDLSGRTSDATFQIAIPYPDGTGSSVKNARVTYSIAPNPSPAP